MAETFSHHTLGKLIPKSLDGVNQFLGLKYASIKDRLAAPELYSPTSATVIDATQHGPSVISPSFGCDLEFGFIQQKLTSPPFFQSELDGLNLNITAPAGASASNKLPVFVFIHGGGFFIGGNSWPQYDMAKFVRLSIDLGEPIIAININYRLGIFGNLTSKELTNQGYLGNNSLRDQQVAFEWIKKNIAGFGGDPENIAVGGESAGGVSTTLHLYDKKPHFAQAISFGGTGLLLKPLPPFVHEMTYQTVLENLEIDSLSPQERLAAILTMPVEDILSKIPPGLPLYPVVDGVLIPSVPTFSDILNKNTLTMPGKHWCKGLLIGDNQLDASILIGGMESHEGSLVDNFIGSITRNLESYPKVAETLLNIYGITSSMPKEEAVFAILNFSTDIGMVAPTLTYAKGWPGEAFVYFFNEPNPWEGRFKGYSSHILDVAYVFQNYSEHLNPAQKESSRRFAADVIKFVNGKAPWTEFDEKSPSVRVYGPSETGNSAVVLEVEGNQPELTKRRGDIFQFATEPGLDVISNAFGLFLAGR